MRLTDISTPASASRARTAAMHCVGPCHSSASSAGGRTSILSRSSRSVANEGNCFAFIEGQFQRSIVRLQKHVGNNHFVLQLGMLALVPGVLVIAHVIPGPAVESIFLHRTDVIGDKIIAEFVALISPSTELASSRIDRNAYRIANSRRIDLYGLAVRGELQDIRAVKLSQMGVCNWFNVGTGADGHEELAAIRRECQITGSNGRLRAGERRGTITCALPTGFEIFVSVGSGSNVNDPESSIRPSFTARVSCGSARRAT